MTDTSVCSPQGGGMALGSSCSPSLVGGEVLLPRRDATVILCPRRGEGSWLVGEVAGVAPQNQWALPLTVPLTPSLPARCTNRLFYLAACGLRTDGRLASCPSPPGPPGAGKTGLREAAGPGRQRARLRGARLWAQGLPLPSVISDRCTALCLSVPSLQ